MEKLALDSRILKKAFSNWWAILLGGVLLAVLVIAGLRTALYKHDKVHYHANFALYINGQQDEFKSFTFYEEIAACSVDGHQDPKTRVHMHDNNNHLIHVHDHSVTWSQFFTNLGYSLGDNLVATDNGVYISGQDGKQLTFILNGTQVDHIANQIIDSEDVLLINYGNEDNTLLQARFDKIPRDAHKANVTADPATCSGQEALTFVQRLKHALKLSN